MRGLGTSRLGAGLQQFSDGLGPSRSRRRALSWLMGMAVTLGLCLGGAVPSSVALATAGSLQVVPQGTIAGEQVALQGNVPPRRSRPVLLQRRRGDSWVTVARGRSGSTGAFRFFTPTPSSTTTYRVLAPRARIGGRTYAKVQTPRRQVVPVKQQGSLSLPGTARVGDTVAVSATFVPARVGRTVQLQRRSGDGWVVADSSSQDADGVAAFTITPASAGEHTYRALTVPAQGAAAATTDDVTLSASKPFVTRVSPNGRFFVDQWGNPILVKGDSPWAILQNASTAEMDLYVSTRASQGFNMVLLGLMGSVGLGGPSNTGATYDGILPLVGGDPGTLNDAYWDRVEYFISACEVAGISVMAYPLDGWNALDQGVASRWSQEQANTYGQAVAARLGSHPNIVWAVGGDYSSAAGNTYDDRFWGVLQGLQAGGMDRIRTIQFTLDQTSLSSTFWDDKVDFNFVYSYGIAYENVERAYGQSKPDGHHVPALMSEAHYENYDVVTDLYLRSVVGWSLTSGSPGEFYGSEDVWDAAPTVATLDTTAVSQIAAMRAVFEGLPNWWDLVPDHSSSFITGGRGTKLAGSFEYRSGNTYVTGARTPDGRLAVLYIPDATGSTVTIDEAKMGPDYTATWYDPTGGAPTAATPGSSYRKSGANAAGASDWFLVLESSTAR